MTDDEITQDLATSAAEELGQMMCSGGLDGSDLPAAVNFGAGPRYGLGSNTGVIELEDGRRVVFTVTVQPGGSHAD